MNPRPWWKIVDWRIVVAVGVPLWLLVAGGVYSATSHQAAPQVERPPPIVSPLPYKPYPTAPREVLPSPRAVREEVAAPRFVDTEVVAAPREIRVDPALVDFLANAIRSFRIPGPAPAPPAVAKIVADIPEGCKLHGTALHFVKSPVEAFKLAPNQDKLVFILHLAGNIEDDGFT